MMIQDYQGFESLPPPAMGTAPQSDIDFAYLLSAEIGDSYKEAKDYCRQLPGHSLVQIRSLCSLACDLMADTLGIAFQTADLGGKIAELRRSGLVPVRIVDKLHLLRRNGNKGAHPEEFKTGPHAFSEIAEHSLEDARTVLEWLYRRRNPGASIPAYHVSDSGLADVKHLCYEALLSADPDALYKAGKLVAEKARQRREDGREARKHVDQSLLCFRLAAEAGHAPSMYEYGLALAQGLEGEERRAEGEGWIERASRNGDINANAFVGRCMMEGTGIFKQDHAQARKCLEIAAQADHPEALANLGVMCHRGWGGPVDPRAAFAHTKRAADAGFPNAQFNLAILYQRGEGTERDEDAALDYLTRAAEQGHPEAMLDLANEIAFWHVPGKSLEDAEALFLQALRHCNRARLGLALLYKAKGSTEEVINAAYLLQQCFETALQDGDGDLAEACRQDGPEIAAGLRQLLRSRKLEKKQWQSALFAAFLFDENGQPYPSRAQREKEFAARPSRHDHARNGKKGSPASSYLSLASSHLPAKNGLKIGRNDPCHCGSGKKYKFCHGA